MPGLAELRQKYQNPRHRPHVTDPRRQVPLKQTRGVSALTDMANRANHIRDDNTDNPCAVRSTEKPSSRRSGKTRSDSAALSAILPSKGPVAKDDQERGSHRRWLARCRQVHGKQVRVLRRRRADFQKTVLSNQAIEPPPALIVLTRPSADGRVIRDLWSKLIPALPPWIARYRHRPAHVERDDVVATSD